MARIRKIALAITIIGAFNWGVIGLLNFDVVGQFSNGYEKPLARFFYFVIGISGLLSMGYLYENIRVPEDRRRGVVNTEEA